MRGWRLLSDGVRTVAPALFMRGERPSARGWMTKIEPMPENPSRVIATFNLGYPYATISGDPGSFTQAYVTFEHEQQRARGGDIVFGADLRDALGGVDLYGDALLEEARQARRETMRLAEEVRELRMQATVSANELGEARAELKRREEDRQVIAGRYRAESAQDARILDLMAAERARAEKKFPGSTIDAPGNSNDRRFRILAEEVMEVAQAIERLETTDPLSLGIRRTHLRDELVQVATCAFGWLRSLVE